MTGPMQALDETRLLLQAFEVLSGDSRIAYLSTPITSGRRELALLRRLGCTLPELRRDHAATWRREVIEPNEEDADRHAEIARKRLAPELVANPARLRHGAWTQDQYNAFWTALLEERADRVVLAPDWMYSRGARIEVGAAVRLGIPLEDLLGSPVTPAAVAEADRAVRAELAADGWPAAWLDHYLTALPSPPDGAPPVPGEDYDVERSAAAALRWLVGERAYQVRKFGTATDDAHTAEGLGDDGWWWRQLTTYFHRARVLTLANPLGRQALAKFTATAVGLLESVVRVHGELPPPGVPSGDVGGGDGGGRSPRP
ncbi:MAG TPA: DUF4406 domain-containing protein [Acidimicrobiales bacterium]